MKTFGIIGKPLLHSFSPDYFNSKFEKLGLSDHIYQRFELEDISQLGSVLYSNPDLVGLNVTHPYKTSVIPFLHSLDEVSKEIGAVNTICIHKTQLHGFNTDVVGFKQTLNGLNIPNVGALILGNGGASKAVSWVFEQMKKPYLIVSRNPIQKEISYSEINQSVLDQYPIIVNCTPLGMASNHILAPEIPYRHLNSKNVLIDLIYQPRVTTFLKQGLQRGCIVKNGFEMLKSQAEASWNLWKSY